MQEVLFHLALHLLVTSAAAIGPAFDISWLHAPHVRTTRHEAHHHNGRVYYQQYFKYIDDFFGFTEDKGTKNELETIRRGVELRKQQQLEQGEQEQTNAQRPE